MVSKDGDTVCDNKTGLWWQQSPSTDTFVWGPVQDPISNALDHCEDLTLSGKTWRLSAGESHREQPIEPKSQGARVDPRRQPRGENSRRISIGVTIINGKRYTFNSREEYEKLKREIARLRKQKP